MPAHDLTLSRLSFSRLSQHCKRTALAVVCSLITVIMALVVSIPATAQPDRQPTGAIPPDGPAQAWLVADAVSGQVLGGKNLYGAYAPASTIKILLAMVVLDTLAPGAAIRAETRHTTVECSCVGLVAGQVYTAQQLLDGLLLVSGNDAANALADMLGGYELAVRAMNMKAYQLGARNTRAQSPSGLDGPGWESVSSPHDLAVLYRAAQRYPLLVNIMHQPSALFPAGNNGVKKIVNQDHLLRSYPGFIGGKTGYTNLARKTYVGVAQRNGRRLIVVQMYGKGDMWDHAAALLDWGFEKR